MSLPTIIVWNPNGALIDGMTHRLMAHNLPDQARLSSGAFNTAGSMRVTVTASLASDGSGRTILAVGANGV